MVKTPYEVPPRPGRRIDIVPPCRKTMKELPDDVRDIASFALTMAAHGRMHGDVKPLKGFPGISVQEVAIHHDGNAYRVIFTIRYPEALYVLHVFQKKSHKGIETPRHEIELVRDRLGKPHAWRLK